MLQKFDSDLRLYVKLSLDKNVCFYFILTEACVTNYKSIWESCCIKMACTE